jgi:ketosteroid isomerase-like protein
MTTTTPDSAAIVGLLLEAFLAGDVETFMSYIDEDMEWNPAEHHPFLTQPYRGRQQFLEGAVAKVAAELDGFRFDIQRVLECGEVVRRIPRPQSERVRPGWKAQGPTFRFSG